MKFSQFEIWSADLSPRFGTEPGKVRPVLIIQCDALNKSHPSTIICPLTTIVRKNVSILRVNLSEGESGLNKPSAIMVDQLRAIDNKRFVRKIGKLSTRKSRKVIENIKIVLDIYS